jgi:hypothetical protein
MDSQAFHGTREEKIKLHSNRVSELIFCTGYECTHSMQTLLYSCYLSVLCSVQRRVFGFYI